MKNISLIFIVFLGVIGCVEEYDFNFENIKSRVVVDGLITNQPGPYYVRLTKSNTGGFTSPDYTGDLDNAEPVKNAVITISDDMGQTDTLVPAEIDLEGTVYHTNLGYFKFIKDGLGNVIDSVYYYNPYIDAGGFYRTTDLLGVPGHSYTLQVISEGKIYHAKAYMPPVPVIDSLGWKKMISEKDGQVFDIPLLYFKEPQDTDNYYLIQTIKDSFTRTHIAQALWEFSILSDAFLEPNVNGLTVAQGATPRATTYPRVISYIALSSLTPSAYDYYKALLSQFENNGGAYKQTPASPPTNINNDGLGFFRASAVSEIETNHLPME